jgi:hypothetical protein
MPDLVSDRRKEGRRESACVCDPSGVGSLDLLITADERER